LRKPKIGRLGVDVAGVVEAAGKAVTQFHPGDEVFGVCRGAYAEYACGPASQLVSKPHNVSFEQAAAVPVAGITALQGLRDRAKVEAGQKVVINGAGGGVGTFAVQIAKAMRAEVTGVTRTSNVDTIRAIGADRVVDYTRENFTKRSERFDVIFDVGLTHSVAELKRALTKSGTCVFVGGPTGGSMFSSFVVVLKALAQSPFISQSFKIVPARANKEDLDVLREFLAAEQIKPVIDTTYPLSELAEAMRHFADGSVCGKIVITMNP
jgi:NADPH:quinone reductase and related Zn-dependent oxidoreductases